jgi:hypothetical protein
MPISAVVKNFRDGTLVISDGTTPTPLSLTVQYEAGDFSISALNEGYVETTVYTDRGEFGSLRKTNRTFPTGSFTAHFTDLQDASNATLYGLATWTGFFAAGVSSLGTASDAKTYKTLVWTCEGTNFGDASDHVLTLADVRITSVDIAEGDPNSYTVNFTVFGAITAV